MNDDIVQQVDPWSLLTQQEQYVYIEKARYLLDRNYIEDHDATPESLGRRIYLSTQENADGTSDDSRVPGESIESKLSS